MTRDTTFRRTTAQLRVLLDLFELLKTGPKQLNILSRFYDGEWKQLRDLTNRLANEYNSVKAALAQLEGKGLLLMRESIKSGQEYQITPAGRTLVESFLAQK